MKKQFEKLYGPGIMVKTKQGKIGYIPESEPNHSEKFVVMIDGKRTLERKGTLTLV